MTSRNRKSYLQLKKSMIEFFTAPVRYLKEGNTKESAFEKPYADSEYRSMHFDIPQPDWPSWKFDVVSDRRPPPDEVLGTGAHCKGCVLSSYRILADECETNSIQFYSSVRCVLEKYGFFAPPASLSLAPAIIGPNRVPGTRTNVSGAKGWGNTILKVEALIGEIIAIRPDWFADVRPGIEVFVNPDIATHVLLGTMIDDLGNVCTELVEVSCEACTCPPETAFEFDDGSTPDTIAPGGNITVYVTGGCAPFSWGAAGTGYSWAEATTTDRQNVLTSESGD